jgi:NAD+ kinase
MKVILRGPYRDDIVPLLLKHDATIVNRNPDLIVAYGGDGTLLGADREFPTIPKLAIRDTRAAKLCEIHSHGKIMKDMFSGKLEKSEIIRLLGKFQKKEILAVNDIFIHNFHRVSAIRYRVFINGKVYLNEVASDAFGIATPHGSTAYYKSITNCIFTAGIGLAFSNSRENVNHIVLPDDVAIKVEILRGPALIMADNSLDYFILNTGESIEINKFSQTATVYGLETFMCPACRKLRHMKL